MTDLSEHHRLGKLARHAAAKKRSKSMFNTIPIVLVGSMAIGLGFTGPVDLATAKRIDKPKVSPSDLGKVLKDALADASSRVTSHVITPGTVTTAGAAPSTYRVSAGDTVSGIAGRFGLATASVLAMNGLGWKSIIFPGQILKLNKGAVRTTTPHATQPRTTPTTHSNRYTIVRGDTISRIAAKFHVSTASVLSANGLSASSIIYPGQTVAIPGQPAHPRAATAPKATTPQPAPPKAATPTSSTALASVPGSYVVKSGDTIGAIAAKFHLSTAAVLSANRLKASSIIYPGQRVTIPGLPTSASPAQNPAPTVPTPVPVVTAPPSAPQRYVITVGDTISSIATKFGVSIQAILNANGLSWSSLIYTGRAIVIPAVIVTPAGTDVTTALTSDMTRNANTIIAVGKSLGVSDYGLVIALSAAMQESSLLNLNYGDRDSLGLFQQRPSTGWGTPAQVTNTTYAAQLFFGGPSNPNKGITAGLLEIPGWQTMTVTQAAQAVQKSAYPDAYAKWEASAWVWLEQLT
jgi:N-acetylmuramoyl-L-alanine amidase